MPKESKIIHKTPKPIKLSKIKVRKARKNSWSVNQQKLYLQFLKKHLSLMKNQESRRAFKVFKMMSAMIGSRTPVQIKTHHQKLEEKYQTTSNIIHHVELIIKKTIILEAQEKVKSSVASLQSKQTLRSLDQFKQIENEDEDCQNDQLSCGLFFNQQSKDYSEIQFRLQIDQNQPLI